MPRLTDLLPDANLVLALQPEELAKAVLQVARSRLQNGTVHLSALFFDIFQGEPHAFGNPNVYPTNQRNQIELAVTEAWTWLLTNLLLVRDPGHNGGNGYVCIGRRAVAIQDDADFANFLAAAAFPKSLLHPLIADDVWIRVARKEYDIAVFAAFRAVEERVRIVGGYVATDIGVPLMRRAFDPDNGPLAKQTDPRPEREALAHLFAGAIGSYKNPHSHRTVTIDDAREAQEIVVLASHLLRIIDARMQH